MTDETSSATTALSTHVCKVLK